MKKLLAMLLTLILVSGMLVSCADETIGDYLPNYDGYEPETVEELTLNLYIITNADTVKNASDTVAQRINSYTTSKFNTTLNVHYYTANQYQAKVMEEVNASDADSANIILINSYSLMTNLVNAEKLADLTSYLQTDKYGKLNVQIADALLRGSMINDKLYSIPNNHVVGEYEYIVFDKEVVQKYKEIPSVVAGYKSVEDAAALVEKIEAAGENYTDYISLKTGNYELKAQLEAEGNICNVVTYPTVDNNTAFSSAFAVVDRGDKYNERAMEIIYAINTEVELRNLLQYGVKGTNYDVVNGDIVMKKDSQNVYSMNLLYTGNIFTASCCSEINWTELAKAYGALQNKEAVIKEIVEE